LLEARGWGGEGRGRSRGGEMTQTLYAHMNKRKLKKIKASFEMASGEVVLSRESQRSVIALYIVKLCC
jgi:hypothetical protein